MKLTRSIIFTSIACVALALGAVFFMFVAIQGLSGAGLSLGTKGGISHYTGLPSRVLGVGFLCFSLGCALLLIDLLFKRSAIDVSGIAVLLFLAFFSLFPIALLLAVFSIGVPNDQPLTPLRIFGGIGIMAFLAYKISR